MRLCVNAKILVGWSVADVGFWKREFQCALDCYTWQSIIKCAKHVPAMGVWGHAPPSRIFDFRPSEIVSGTVLGSNSKSWTTLLPNLVIGFEAFKHSQNLKMWLRFAPQRLQSSPARRGKKKKENLKLASYCTRLVGALWS